MVRSHMRFEPEAEHKHKSFKPALFTDSFMLSFAVQWNPKDPLNKGNLPIMDTCCVHTNRVLAAVWRSIHTQPQLSKVM